MKIKFIWIVSILLAVVWIIQVIPGGYAYITNSGSPNSLRVPVDIDDEAPIVDYLYYDVQRTKIKFYFGIEEDNFKDIVYKDMSECSRNYIKYGTFCSSLNKYGECKNTRDYCRGLHHFIITARDKAGNSAEPIELDIYVG